MRNDTIIFAMNNKSFASQFENELRAFQCYSYLF